MQARANDVYDVGRRVMGLLIGEAEQQITLIEPVILVATDLSPSDTAQLDPAMVKGIILEQGGEYVAFCYFGSLAGYSGRCRS